MSIRHCLMVLPLGASLAVRANDWVRHGRTWRQEQAAIAAAASGETPVPPKVSTPSYWEQGHLFGDWLGLGPAMRTNGVVLAGDFTTDLLGNPVGGLSQGFAPATSLGLQLQWTPGELWTVPLPDTEFVTSMIWRTGENLSAEHIGNLFTVAQLYGGENLRLYEFLLRQYLFDRQLELQIGRQGAFDQFLAFPIFCNYVNNGTCGSPKGTYFSIPAFGQTVYPTSSWGAFAKWKGTDEPWYLQAGGYLLDSDNGANDTHGLNWTFDVDLGAAAMAQAGYMTHQAPGDPGLPGSYAIGGFYSEAGQPVFNEPGAVRSNGGGYLVLQQMLFRPDASAANLRRHRNLWGWGGQSGLTAFTVLVATPDDSVSQFPFFMNGGLVYQGLIPGRPEDFLAFGFNWGGTGTSWQQQQTALDLPSPAREVVLEWNYRCSVTPFLYVQPDLQWVINPSLPSALVVGAQLSVVF
ncbi:MAG: carbohydrate porin [Verrucomicrobia bacterium]|nr:carbohydrate porin [Verrucomicrobiota bacterium]